MATEPYDVLVIGGGIAALCAALAARRAGASVLLADRAPRWMRGGNTRHSRNLRLAHDAPTPLMPGRYPAEELVADLNATSRGRCDEALAWTLAEGSRWLPAWLQAQGAHFQQPSGGTLPWSRKTAFFHGGGKRLINSLYATAEALGVEIAHETRITDLLLADAPLHAVPAERRGAPVTLHARAVALCAGGYPANRRALASAWGAATQAMHVRGTPYAEGELLLSLLQQGAAATGSPGACHLVAVNAESPVADGGIVTRVDGVPWGIVVDRQGRRFADEGAETSPRRYAHWGRLVAERAGGRAYLILDAEGLERTPPSIYAPFSAATPEALARRLGIPPARLGASIARYNAALRRCAPGERRTEGLAPAKSRYALPLATPPFHAYPMAPGITFTGHGLAVDSRARLRRSDGTPCQRLLAAGMAMAPALLGTGYTAGSAVTIGAVFGRIAGEQAARVAAAPQGAL